MIFFEVSITPLGNPVVPEVYRIATVSSISFCATSSSVSIGSTVSGNGLVVSISVIIGGSMSCPSSFSTKEGDTMTTLGSASLMIRISSFS